MKKLIGFGVANRRYDNKEHAMSFTYDDKAGSFPTTQLVFDGNPYNEEVRNAKAILDFGCGVGRNLRWIMENTKAMYYGIDPNEDMLKYFWDVNADMEQHRNRVVIGNSFDIMPSNIDLVVVTFVFQHFTYRTGRNIMNVDDITRYIVAKTKPGTPWIMLEHESEDPGWQEKWMRHCGINPDVYIKDYTKVGVCHQPELCDRGNHNLIIFKK